MRKTILIIVTLFAGVVAVGAAVVAYLFYILVEPQSMARDAPPDTGPQGLAIVNARVFTGLDDTVLPNATILTEGDRILEVTADPVAIGEHQIIDAQGRFVMPGLIETHAHLFFDFHSLLIFRDRPTSDAEARAYMAGRMREKLADYLDKGFTTVMSPGDFFPHIVEVKRDLEAGAYPGPRLFVAGGIFTAPGEHPVSTICGGDPWCGDHVAAQVASVEEARDRVNEYVDGGVDFLKITYMADNGATLLSPDIVEAIIDQAHARGIPAYAHVSRQDHFAMFDSFGVDGFVHPSDGPSSTNFGYYDRVADRALPMSVTTSNPVELLTDSLGITDTLAEPGTTQQSESIAYFREQGGAPVFGTDLPGFSVWSAKAIGLRSLRRLGFSNADVLRAMTSVPADRFLRDEDLGSLAPGRKADIIFVDGDPLASLRDLGAVDLVIQNGIVKVSK